MQRGVTFAQTELDADPAAVRDVVQAAEGLGYDHMLGADVSQYPGWHGAYTHRHLLHEPLVLFDSLAALTHRLQLVTAVIILGQRQTALVAQQAAEVDVLSGGRLRPGVGIGWNPVEYAALGANFHDRGTRSEEQIAVLRALWTHEVMDFHGRWHHISHAGLNPRPVQQPIPLWLGGGRPGVDAVLERIGRVADGWFPQFLPDALGRDTLERMRASARAAGRDPARIGIEGRICVTSGTPDAWAHEAEDWGAVGATHLSVTTMDAGDQTPHVPGGTFCPALSSASRFPPACLDGQCPPRLLADTIGNE